MFNKNKRKGIINQAVLDLRKYTPQALENVRLINSSLVIFSENPSEELMTAYGNVQTKNVAITLNLPDNKKVVTFNGASLLNKVNYTENAIHITNGICVIQRVDNAEPIEIITNGLTVYDKNSKINFIVQNGLCVKSPFDIDDVKIFANDAKVDSMFIENLSDGTVVVAGHNIVIYNDVTLELLKSKQIYLVAGSEIKCNYNILGYIQTIATAGNKIEVDG